MIDKIRRFDQRRPGALLFWIGMPLLLAGMAVAFQKKAPAPPSASEVYIARQGKIIDDHVAILVKEGRMPVDFGRAYLYLASYGWHTSSEVAAPGPNPPLWLLQEGARSGGGSFGAYSFSPPAFEQAKRSWWIHGVMKAGSDLLLAVNVNAEFVQAACYTADGCEPPMNSAVGYDVGFLDHGPEDAKVVAVVNGRTLRLDKKSPGDVLQFNVAILPPEFVDYCRCSMSTINGGAGWSWGVKR